MTDVEHRDESPVGRTPRRRWVRALGWALAVAAWVLVCFTWLFPWLAEQGLNPTLTG